MVIPIGIEGAPAQCGRIPILRPASKPTRSMETAFKMEKSDSYFLFIGKAVHLLASV